LIRSIKNNSIRKENIKKQIKNLFRTSKTLAGIITKLKNDDKISLSLTKLD